MTSKLSELQMKEIKRIIEFYKSDQNNGFRKALATVVNVEESSYRRIGARMLILENGQWIGGISGGCIEGDTLRKAQQVMQHQKPQIVTYDTREGDDYQIGVGLGCQGRIDVLIEPLNEGSSTMKLLNNALCFRRLHILATPLETSEDGYIKMAQSVYANDALPSPLISMLRVDIHEIKIKPQSKVVGLTYYEKQIPVLLEMIKPNIQIHIFGDNYDVYPLINMCLELGWDVSIYAQLNKLEKTISKQVKLFPKSKFKTIKPNGLCMWL